MAPVTMQQQDEVSITSEQLLQAQTHVFHHMFALSGCTALKCAIELGIPDAIHAHGGGPVTVPELASSLCIPASKTSSLGRLMRLLAQMGYFAPSLAAVFAGAGEDATTNAAYSLTPNSIVLVKESAVSLSSLVLLWLDHFMVSVSNAYSSWYRHDGTETPFELDKGDDFWKFASMNTGYNRLFNATMASETRLDMKATLTRCRDAFQGIRTLVDVGGGHGMSTRMIAEAFPEIKCTLYDLPHVIADAPKSSLVEAVAGSMLDHVPKADAVFMKNILHDWSDEDCVKILRQCKEAIPSREEGGKVIVVDIVINNGDGEDVEYSKRLRETQLFSDMAMVLIGGAERDVREWSKIFAEAGFTEYKFTSIGVRSLIELFP